MSIYNDWVDNLPPFEPSGRGRDELFGSVTEPVPVRSWDDREVTQEEYDLSTVQFKPLQKHVGICPMCGAEISAQRFFDVGLCYRCA